MLLVLISKQPGSKLNDDETVLFPCCVHAGSQSDAGYTNRGSDYFSAGEVQSLGDEQDIKVQPGTILINLVDNKTDQVVWTGLASGLTTNEGFDRQQGKIREAVNLIFNRFNYRADRY